MSGSSERVATVVLLNLSMLADDPGGFLLDCSPEQAAVLAAGLVGV